MARSGLGYKRAEQFGVRIAPPRPALVTLTFDARVAGAVWGFIGGVCRCGRELRQDTVRRGPALYASRVERTGDFADIVLLARRSRHRHRYGAAGRRFGRLKKNARRASPAGNGDRAG